MAGRIRSIKPEILDDEKTAALSHLEWRLFVSLWLIADDYGNLRGDAGYILGQTLWSTGETRVSVEKALETLANVSLLSSYSVRGQSYYHVGGWAKHQRVDKPGKPRMPGPDEDDHSAEQVHTAHSGESRECLANVSREPHVTLAPDLRSPIIDHDLDLVGQADKAAPSPKPRTKSRRKRLPQEWTPRDTERQLAKSSGIDCDQLAHRFKRHYAASGHTLVDWDEKFASWIENEGGRINGNRQPGRQQSIPDPPRQIKTLLPL